MAKRRVYINKKTGLVVDDLPLTTPATDAEKRDFTIQEVEMPPNGKEITINGTIYARHALSLKLKTLVELNNDPTLTEIKKNINPSAAEIMEP